MERQLEGFGRVQDQLPIGRIPALRPATHELSKVPADTRRIAEQLARVDTDSNRLRH
jgi:hypothetical protein